MEEGKSHKKAKRDVLDVFERSQHPVAVWGSTRVKGNPAFEELVAKLGDGDGDCACERVDDDDDDDDVFERTGHLLVVIGVRRAPLLLRRLGGFDDDTLLYEVEANCLAYYRRCDHATVDGSWLWFVKQNLEHMDSRFWRCLGFTGDDLPEHVPTSWISRLKLDDDKKAKSAFEEHARTRGREPYFCVVRYEEAKQQPVVVFCRGETVIWDERDGSPLMMTGVHVNVTALYRRATANVVRMAHEIKTPLSSLAEALEILAAGRREKDEMWDVCTASLEQLKHAIADAILLSQLNLGSIENDTSPVLISKLVESVVRMSQGPVSERTQSILMVGEDACFELPEFHVRTVLNNLVGNASKYSPHGSKIEISWTWTDEEIVFEVKDKGIGIPEDKWIHVFEESAGGGLGLATCKRLCGNAGGTVEVAASGPFGTTFRVRIRTSRLDSQKKKKMMKKIIVVPTTTTTTESAAAAAAAAATTRVLLVDDVATNRAVAKRRLCKLGCQDITEATCGMEAIDSLTKHSFDLVILDVHMPDVDGDQNTRISGPPPATFAP
ncbi:hypothetical protein CTAYLR_003811 [Chrysophaeum taylorii]|uniref:histidine kinase n=1 Tax=Chrysophaeum taylorii TaxID=2483200 RepID=A0AAD7UF23_9STRA|nr:hypothetical protein CTAYLR_003811 [Chrysophaeum taylorii]